MPLLAPSHRTPMKILVTGAAGNVGPNVVRELLAHGHEVRALDIVAPPADVREKAEVVYADIADRKAMLQAALGCDAITHLGAIPNPVGGKELEIFEPNVVGTQYVLAAAEAYGIQRVVLASSCSIYGAAFARTKYQHQYLPIDEFHPFHLEDLYGLSKQFNELNAEVITRRSGIATTCLRLNHVTFFDRPRSILRHIEHSHQWRQSEFWHYVEARDVAVAFRLALENVETGHHKVIVVARDIYTAHDRRELLRQHYPELAHYLDGDWDFDKYGFYDSRPAEELFGFVAQHFWRDVPELREAGEKSMEQQRG
ncbi:NAD(P)-dependent oxidoreductase [bacterium]|nr:MAG: NAD(P)-dependent oxidoreductase [bacterium]